MATHKTPLELMMEASAARRKTAGPAGPDTVSCEHGAVVKIARDEAGNPYGYAVKVGDSKDTFLTPRVLDALTKLTAGDFAKLLVAWNRKASAEEVAVLAARKEASIARRKTIKALAAGHSAVRSVSVVPGA